MKRLLAACAAILLSAACAAADTPVYTSSPPATWAAIASDVHATGDVGDSASCARFGNAAAAFKGGAYPPGQWYASPAGAWTLYCQQILSGGGFILGARVAGDGVSFGPPIGYAVVRNAGAGQFEIVEVRSAYDLTAAMQMRAAAAGGVLGRFVTTFVPQP